MHPSWEQPFAVLRTKVDRRGEEYRDNREKNLADLATVALAFEKARAGGGEKYTARHKARGKLLPRERIELLLDRDSWFLEIGALSGHLMPGEVTGGSVVGGVGLVSGVECLISASEATVKGGAVTPMTLVKSGRLAQIAEQNHLPAISLIESAGADLPNQSKIFVPGGQGFRDLTRRSEARLPTVCVVFGSSTAGGAYLPGMSDYVVMVKEQAQVYLAGPPLVKMATGEESTHEELGGAEMHSSVSGVSDYLAEDETDAIRIAREIVAHFDWRKPSAPTPRAAPEPLYDPDELLGIASNDIRMPYDSREVIARIVDGSRFSEFKPRYGKTLVTGWARIHGYPVGILANNGILFGDSAEKGAQFIQLCNQIDCPLLYLQNITGFMVGKKYEQEGIIRAGAKMINAVSNSTVPAITIMTGASYGAGNYAMSGRAYEPRFLFTWPNHRIAVMGGKQLAGVLDIIQRQSAANKGQEVDEEKLSVMKQMIEGQIDAESQALFATARVWDDGIIDPRDTRTVVALSLSAAYNREVRGTTSWGVFGIEMSDEHGIKHIERVLVANRGEIARRVMRTCHAMGISTVAVFSDPDADAPHVRDADVAVRIGPAPSRESYLNVARLIDAAKSAGADAVHPGYGFLSENADFAEACEAAGLVFIGPTADAIRAMGDKRRAKEIVRAAGVPVVPGYDGADQNPAVLAAEAKEIGFPVLLKASAGGGGKGMRVVTDASDLPEEIAAAKREAAGAFGDDTLLVEKYVDRPRHVEIQILGDAHGQVVHLFERECSIQRRHQKIIEESPSPGLTGEERERMGAAAVEVARAIGYRNAGTVEFILAPDRSFYFLEVNTRLQVEHPVTEMVTGLDLVREQVRVARGEALGYDQTSLQMSGAAIECRIYAEDPDAGYLPASGDIVDFHLPEALGLRIDSGVDAGTNVSIHYDPMLAKIITRGVDRAEALARMRRALAKLSIAGVTTNRAFLRRVVSHPDFIAGRLDTHFIDTHAAALAAPAAASTRARTAAIAATIFAHEARVASRPGPAVPSGFRLNDFAPQWVEYTSGEDTIRLEYRSRGGGRFFVTALDESTEVRVLDVEGASLAFQDGELRRQARVVQSGARHHVQIDGEATSLVERPRFPEPDAGVTKGGCVAPMPGAIVEVTVSEGASVSVGQVLVRMEAMKMEHAVKAPHGGVVGRVLVAVGNQVEADALLVVVDGE